ncbi:hypothetical protein [Aquimarina megaterium]|nr:hypothetical protein [Aquimarina megaterium]
MRYLNCSATSETGATAKTQGFETIQFHGIRDTGVRKGQRQSTSVINLID